MDACGEVGEIPQAEKGKETTWDVDLFPFRNAASNQGIMAERVLQDVRKCWFVIPDPAQSIPGCDYPRDPFVWRRVSHKLAFGTYNFLLLKTGVQVICHTPFPVVLGDLSYTFPCRFGWSGIINLRHIHVTMNKTELATKELKALRFTWCSAN